MVDRIYVEVDPLMQNISGMQSFRDGNQTLSVWLMGEWDKTDTAFIGCRDRYNDGDPLVFIGGTKYYAETEAEADPDDATFPTYPPARWMLENHPFKPLSAYDIQQYADGYTSLPAEGFDKSLYVVTDSSGQKHPLIWDNTNFKSMTYKGPITEKQDYSLTSDVHIDLFDINTDAGNAIDVITPLGVVAPSESSLTNLQVTNPSSTILNGIKANSSTTLSAVYSLTVTPDNDSDDAVWRDSGSIVRGQPNRYIFQIGLGKWDTDDTSSNTSYTLQTYSGPTTAGNIPRIGIKKEITNIQLNEGELLQLYMRPGASAASDTNRYSKGVTITGGTLTLRRYESNIAREAADTHSILALDNTVLGSSSTVDFETPINVDDYPVAHFRPRFDRQDRWAVQDLTFDLRELDIVATSAAATTALSSSDSSNRDTQLVITYLQDAKGRPTIFQGYPWDGWYTDRLYEIKMVFYGTGRVINGVVINTYIANSDMTMKLDMECRR